MWKRIVSLIIISFYLCGCTTVYNPATQRKELVFIDTASEVSLGKMISRNIRRDYRISSDPTLNQRVKKIGEAIAAVCDRKDLDYRFFVVEDKELNAFSIPGGFIYVNTGLLKKASEDELAGVIAHEIGHVVARHSIKQLQAALGFDIVMSIAFNKSDAVNLFRATNIIYKLISLGYSREDERQADKLAVSYTFRAKYDPRGMLTFFGKIREEEKKEGTVNIPVFLRSHPAINERIENIKKEIAVLEHAQINAQNDKSSFEGNVAGNLAQEAVTDLPKDKVPIIKEQTKISRKMCPQCKRIFPSRYNYCPYDGSQLTA